MSSQPATDRDLGLSDGQLAAIELRVLNLTSKAWRRDGTGVVRASLRREGESVAETDSESVAEFIAHAPHDIEGLLRELGVRNMQIEKLRQQVKELQTASAAFRVDCDNYRQRLQEMRGVWITLKKVMEAK